MAVPNSVAIGDCGENSLDGRGGVYEGCGHRAAECDLRARALQGGHALSHASNALQYLLHHLLRSGGALISFEAFRASVL